MNVYFSVGLTSELLFLTEVEPACGRAEASAVGDGTEHSRREGALALSHLLRCLSFMSKSCLDPGPDFMSSWVTPIWKHTDGFRRRSSFVSVLLPVTDPEAALKIKSNLLDLTKSFFPANQFSPPASLQALHNSQMNRLLLVRENTITIL